MSDNTRSQRISINAMGGIVIGLLLACFVIIGGLPLVLGATAGTDFATFPTRVDQRVTGIDASEVLPHHLLEVIEPLVVANAGRPVR